MRLFAFAVILGCTTAATPPAPTAPKPIAAAPVAKSATLTGTWLGTLGVGAKKLRLQIHLDLAANPPTCTLDSLDQGSTGIPCNNVVASATALSFEVPAARGTFKGAVSADASTVTGSWSQGQELPLVLTRQTGTVEAEKIKLDPALPAVTVDKLQAVLDDDLKNVLPTKLPPGAGLGITIGVVEHGTRAIFSYGEVKPDSVFEIGSVTKTFTGLALAQMVEQKRVKLDEPVRALLPKDVVAAPASGAEITLLDLSTQHSGLPRLPGNLKITDLVNPYASYDAKALYAFLADHGVAMPAKPEFGYSNLGVGLLGHALAERAGSTYEALIEKQILTPLAMHDTTIVLSPALAKRFVSGHTAGNKPEAGWDFGVLAGAGAIRSTAADMLTYLEAQLHPDHVTGKTAEAKSLPAAIAASHEVRAEASGGMHIALNWFRIDASGSYWHDGATGGFSSFAMFDPSNDFAVIVLFNRSIEDGTFADDLAAHIVQRLTGRPATSL